MTRVRIIVYTTNDLGNMMDICGRSLPDGVKEFKQGCTIRVQTVYRGGWLRAIWQVWRMR